MFTFQLPNRSETLAAVRSRFRDAAAADRVCAVVSEQFDAAEAGSENARDLTGFIARLLGSADDVSRLHEVSTRHYETMDEMLIAYLETGCQILNLELGIVSRVDVGLDGYVVEAVFPSRADIPPGTSFKLSDTYCAEVVRNRTTVIYDEVGAIETLRQHPVYQTMGLEGYIGTPIWVDDTLYGTLNFSSVHPRKAFHGQDLAFIEMMARNIGQSLSAAQAEQQLVEQRRVLYQFVKHTPAAVAMFDRELRYLVASDRWLEDYGIDREVVGQCHYDVFPEIGDDWKAIHRRCLNGEINSVEEALFSRADGSIDWIRWEIHPWYENDAIGGIIMFTEVITERKEAEHKVQRSERLHRLLAQHLPGTAVLMFDPELRFTLAEGPILQSAGYSPAAMIGRTVDEVLPPASRDALKPMYLRVLNGETFSLERYSGDRYYFSQFVPIFGLDGQVINGMIVVQDITERKLSEIALQRANVNLKQASDEVQQFAYIVSHDLRAQLINLKGFSGVLQAAVDQLNMVGQPLRPTLSEQDGAAWDQAINDRIPVALRFINTAVDRMDRFTSAILKLSRMGRHELHIEPVNTAELVAQLVQSLSNQIETAGTTIDLGPLPTIEGDRLALDQIFGNIITNAIKYLDPNRPGRISVTAEEKPDAIVFHIADNGRGIAADDHDKVFAPFRRIGRPTVEGEGMGLAYVQALIRRCGGQIWFTSEPDVGTTFSFALPAVTEASRHGSETNNPSAG